MNSDMKKSASAFFMKQSSKKRSESVNDVSKTAPKKIKCEAAVTETSPSKELFKSSGLRRPLADEMRPSTLQDYLGQDEVTGPGGKGFWLPLFESIALSGHTAAIPSMIFWGPPGCGKTSLAHVLSSQVSKSNGTQWRFSRLSACTSGVAQVKDEVAKAKNERALFRRSTILFIDEIHRFNKTQQDALLPHVENGTVTLLGATTENPSFSVNSALLSRCRVIMLHKLSPAAILNILKKSLKNRNIEIRPGGEESTCKTTTNHCIELDAIEYLSNVADGDARTALNCLEIAIERLKSSKADDVQKYTISVSDIKAGLKRSHVLYDKKGDEHYHMASALQKSIRGSNDSAALYWLMRMFEGGEDPIFIARRLVRIASEDVGLGDPTALGMAVSAMQGCQLIGKPECDVILAECAVYLARAKKSHEVYGAMNNVKQLLKSCDEGNLPSVPLHLRNATSKLEQNIGYGEGYSYNLNEAAKLSYMPDELKNKSFFDVCNQ